VDCCVTADANVGIELERDVARGTQSPCIDAFIAEIIRTSVISITDEMKSTLQRTAYSPAIYEALDYAVGLFDASGDTTSLGFGVIMWVGGMSEMVKLQVSHWGRENIHPGDILMTNDNEVHGSHINHFIFTQPIFYEEEIVAYASTMAHWPDVGGQLGGPTRDIFAEGFQIPNVKIYKKGVPDQELFDIIRANVRFPDRAMGDVRAQIAAVRTGERRVLALVRRHGAAAFKEALEFINDQSERQARAAVRSIPDGVYRAETVMDSDGVTLDKTLPVAVTVTVSGDEMTIDLSECSRQVAGYLNCGPTAGKSGAQVAFKTLTLPTALPVNVGAMRPLEVILPPGLILSASRDAAKRLWMVVPDTVVDTVWKALSPVMPDRAPAGHHTAIGGAQFYAYIDELGRMSPASGQNAGGISGGGWGAVYNADGQSATIAINDSDVQNAPVEAGEAESPSLVVRRCLEQDSGGPGRFRGGLGITQEVEALVPSMFQSQTERSLCRPWGAFGGKEGRSNRIAIRRKDGTVREFPTAKAFPCRIEPGEAVVSMMGGGGGYGDPLARPTREVLSDVRNEYVSIESARRDYGVPVRREGRQYLCSDQERVTRDFPA
jgi:N-methylhydantoinase B